MTTLNASKQLRYIIFSPSLKKNNFFLLQDDLKIDQDADLIDNEGDSLEEFQAPEYLTDHSRCTLAWSEDWEDTNQEIELKDVLLG